MSLRKKEIIISDVITLLFAVLCYSKKKLTLGGTLSALFIGLIVSFAGYEYYIIMLSFFASSTKATDIHKNIKNQLLGGTYTKEKKRNANQVLAKGFFPTIVSLLIAFLYQGEMHLFSPNLETFQKFLYGMYIGFYVSANADTWASELGINSKDSPRLVTTLQKVPKGINGAISLYGTVMSILGGLFISISTIIIIIIRGGLSIISGTIMIKIIILGMICGFVGSLIDSFLGATLQISIYDEEKKCVIDSDAIDLSQIKNNSKYKIYGRNILNNSAVNFITGVITSLFSGVLFIIL